ncbi:MAG TPA: DNA polymerase Y family protein [Spirochaetia bacterium]|nr:DNA polymerase Y family protein [Spirochaetia bacterium]
MARRGCIRLESLPLQILLRDNPSWAGVPVAVTREEKPQSPILALNRAARDRGLVPGMKYASALSLVPALRARRVAPRRVEEARELIVRTVFSFTPDIEPCPFDVDAIWVSLEGMGSLFGSERSWIDSVRSALAARGFSSLAVAGYTRFGTYVASRGRGSSLVFSSAEEETSLVQRSGIGTLPFSPRTRGMLRRLGVHTVRQFLALPDGEVTRRLGQEAGRLRQALLHDDPLPVRAAEVCERGPSARRLDAPATDLAHLLPPVKDLLEAEVARAEAGRAVISALTLRLRTEEGEWTTELVRPAAPARNAGVLFRLLSLRLSGLQFVSGIEEVQLGSEWTEPSREQGELFAVPRRDLDAGARAFAAIRARYGNGAVVRVGLQESHLPDRSFRWVQTDRPAIPRPQLLPSGPANGTALPAVRRLLFSPRARDDRPPDTVTTLLASGSWWGTDSVDAPYRRAYWYQRSREGLLWLYKDERSATAWLHGWVD